MLAYKVSGLTHVGSNGLGFQCSPSRTPIERIIARFAPSIRSSTSSFRLPKFQQIQPLSVSILVKLTSRCLSLQLLGSAPDKARSGLDVFLVALKFHGPPLPMVMLRVCMKEPKAQRQSASVSSSITGNRNCAHAAHSHRD